MTWLEAALWGLAGGFIVEGIDLHAAVRRHGTWPWRVSGDGPSVGLTGYILAELIRLLVGAILAAGAAASGQVAGPIAAVAIGAAAPIVVERLTALIPLPPAETTNSPSSAPERSITMNATNAADSAERTSQIDVASQRRETSAESGRRNRGGGDDAT